MISDGFNLHEAVVSRIHHRDDIKQCVTMHLTTSSFKTDLQISYILFDEQKQKLQTVERGVTTCTVQYSTKVAYIIDG